MLEHQMLELLKAPAAQSCLQMGFPVKEVRKAILQYRCRYGPYLKGRVNGSVDQRDMHVLLEKLSDLQIHMDHSFIASSHVVFKGEELCQLILDSDSSNSGNISRSNNSTSNISISRNINRSNSSTIDVSNRSNSNGTSSIGRVIYCVTGCQRVAPYTDEYRNEYIGGDVCAICRRGFETAIQLSWIHVINCSECATAV